MCLKWVQGTRVLAPPTPHSPWMGGSRFTSPSPRYPRPRVSNSRPAGHTPPGMQSRMRAASLTRLSQTISLKPLIDTQVIFSNVPPAAVALESVESGPPRLTLWGRGRELLRQALRVTTLTLPLPVSLAFLRASPSSSQRLAVPGAWPHGRDRCGQRRPEADAPLRVPGTHPPSSRLHSSHCLHSGPDESALCLL